nr:ribonuclease H-like domain-containing protein [Tanacetum cinerariifolium]
IEDFFSAPVVNWKWKIDLTDPQLVHFGLMWKIYDMVAICKVEGDGGCLEAMDRSETTRRKNSVLFTDTECLVLSPEFKLPDKNQVLLRVPRENNMYNVNLKNIVPSGDLTRLFAKATLDKSNLWHRRLSHINFKTMNKLVKGKFDWKVDEGFLVGYSVSSKAFRVFNMLS